MPRKIIFETNKISSYENSLSNSKSAKTTTKIFTDRELLFKRSSKYLKSLSGIDTGNLTKTHGFDDLVDMIIEEFGTAGIIDEMIGIVSKCYLGENYVVHILDITGNEILKHFRVNESMPGEFERARSLALHKSYFLVEIYKNKLVCVKEDGSTIVI